MKQIQVSCEEIQFNYQQKGHLKSTFTVTNPNNSNLYYKFKLTRPKYYLLKPQKGFIDAKQSLTFEITLHNEGVTEAENDKVKCFYKFVGNSKEEPPRGWQKEDHETYNIRFTIIINDLPQQFKKVNEGIKNSEVKSLKNSKFDGRLSSGISTIESSIKQKEAKLQILKNQVDSLRKEGVGVKQTMSSYEYGVAVVVGLLIGFISSVWI